MARIGYHASHEQFTPLDLLNWARGGRTGRLRCTMSSDHLAPWSERQGKAALPGRARRRPPGNRAELRSRHGTLRLALSPGDNGPGRRNPCADVSAPPCLACARHWEALNEHVVGGAWPGKAERNARLREAVDVIRELFAGRTVTRDAPIAVSQARLYTLPECPPCADCRGVDAGNRRKGAANGPDGLITVNQSPEKSRR